MIGGLHNIMSRSMYLHSRLALDICDTDLPHWETIRRMMARFRKMLNISIHENVSVLNNRCFSLSLKDMIRHVSFGVHELL